MGVFVIGFAELMNRVETTLEGASPGQKRVYSSRNRLRRDIVANHPVFVSGSSTGTDKLFT